MKRIFFLKVLVFVYAVLAISCEKQDEELVSKTPSVSEFKVQPGIYIVGSVNDGSIYRATLWKDGAQEFLPLPNGYGHSYAQDVFVTESGGVYIAGYANNGQTDEAAVWINGNFTSLDHENGGGYAGSVVVYGSSYYVAGFEEVDGIPKAKVWINGVPNALETSQNRTRATDIVVNGNGVYVVGSEAVDGIKFRAVLWELNKEPIILEENNHFAMANALAFNGADIHVAGTILHSYGGLKAMRWTKGLDSVNLNESELVDASAWDVHVDGTTIYTVGMDNNHAMLWVDEIPFALSNDSDYYSYATSISVNPIDKSVYMVGVKDLGNSNFSAQLWIKSNSEVVNTSLSDQFQSSMANAVFIR
jgi:hypothetical protein